jgi:hypothetical protein
LLPPDEIARSLDISERKVEAMSSGAPVVTAARPR